MRYAPSRNKIALKFFWAFTALLLSIVIAAGPCGGGNDGTRPTPLSKEQTVALLCQFETTKLLLTDQLTEQRALATCNQGDALFPRFDLPSRACDADSSVYKGFLSSVDAGRIKIDPAKLQSCQSKRSALDKGVTSANLLDYYTQLKALNQSDDCRAYLVGQLEAGKPCTLHADCKGNMACVPDEANPTKLTCQAPKGGECYGKEKIACGKGTLCDGLACVAESDRLQKDIDALKTKKGKGGACPSIKDRCDTCLACRAESTTSPTLKCLPRTTDEIPCGFNNECVYGTHYCDFGSKTCKKKPSSGTCGATGFFGACANGYVCDNAEKCVPTPAIGEKCKDPVFGDNNNLTCATGAICTPVLQSDASAVVDTCVVSTGLNGQPCELDSSCDWESGLPVTSDLHRPFICVTQLDKTKRCAARPVLGEKCTYLGQCAEGTQCVTDSGKALCKPSSAGAPCSKAKEFCDSESCVNIDLDGNGQCAAVVPVF